MGSRRQSAQRASVRASKRAPSAGRRTNHHSNGARTKHWRREKRPKRLRSAVAATDSIRWSPALLELLLQEMHVGDGVEELLGSGLRKLPRRQYPRAVAVALILRHSWRADDLDFILECLGINEIRRPKATTAIRSAR